MQLQGKIISFLGDSITEGVGVQNLENRYDNRLKAMCELQEVCNYGISGSRLAHQSVPSEETRFDLYFCGRSYDMNKNSDIIVVFGGTNDYGHGDAPFGDMTDTTPATFCGAVHWLMNQLKRTYPNAITVFMTPARRAGDLAASCDPIKKADAKPLKAYVEVIQANGAALGIPVLNLYENLGIDPNNDLQREAYAPDGLHFNDDGHAILAERLKSFLQAL